MDIENTVSVEPETKKIKKKNDPVKNTAELLIVIILALIFASVLNSAVFEVTFIQQDSMYDTLYGGGDSSVPCDTAFDRFFFGAERSVEYGDKVIVLKTKKVERGDIITFYRENSNGTREKLVKRVIATEGETVTIAGGRVYVNDRLLDENDYVKGNTYAVYDEYRVPAGEIFVLGDNRGVSVDSRIFGTVKLNNVIGRVVLVIQKTSKKLVWAKNL